MNELRWISVMVGSILAIGWWTALCVHFMPREWWTGPTIASGVAAILTGGWVLADWWSHK
jgi:hypothetical protein